jgi:Holliday junction resolvase RusA-like endonuclease
MREPESSSCFTRLVRVADHPTFEYVVYGRPVSTQNEPRAKDGKPKKNAALPKWREGVREAFADAWGDYSKDVLLDPLRLDLIWVYDPGKPNVPDLDNIVKPFTDVPEGALYTEDDLFREMHLLKFELDELQGVDVPNEKLTEALAGHREFVYIRIAPIGREERLQTLRAVGAL